MSMRKPDDTITHDRFLVKGNWNVVENTGRYHTASSSLLSNVLRMSMRIPDDTIMLHRFSCCRQFECG